MIDLNVVVDHLAEGLQVIDRTFTYVHVNPVAAEHGATTPEALVGRRMSDVYPGIEETEMFGRLRRVVEEGMPDRMENEFTYPDGSIRWFELRMAPMPDGAAVLSIDITENKELARQLAHAQKMDAIGQLAGGFAHDFNNLLTVIQTNAVFLADSLPEDDPRAEDASQIMEASEKGAQLTRKMLALARRTPVVPRPVDIAEALNSVGALLTRTIGSHVDLTVTANEPLGKVLIDSSSLDQVLLNLALNARDAMPDGGSLVIEAERTVLTGDLAVRRGVRLQPGRYIVISVSDTGTGIVPDALDRIFDPFFTTKEEGEGTGLGLATSWGLIRQADGAITVYSELDMGTSFRIYLPETDADALPDVSKDRQAGVTLAEKRMMVVEDRDEIRALVARALRQEGVRVLEASSGAEALLLLEDVGSVLDMVIADVVMPRMSGIDLVHRLHRRFPSLPVLLVSGYAPASLGMQAKSLALPLLSKPFTPRQLIAAVGDALSRHTATAR